MRISHEKRPIHERIGTRILNLSVFFQDKGELHEFSGVHRDPPDLTVTHGLAPVPSSGVVLQIEELAQDVVHLGRSEYVNAHKVYLRRPHLEIPERDFYRFISIYDNAELSVVCRRYAALLPLAYTALSNFDVIMPLVERIITGELESLERSPEGYALSGTERDLLERYR